MITVIVHDAFQPGTMTVTESAHMEDMKRDKAVIIAKERQSEWGASLLFTEIWARRVHLALG